MYRILTISVLILFTVFSYAQNHHQRFESIDVQHYCFEIHLNDTTDRIAGKTTIRVKFLKPESSFSLDLVKVRKNRGMEVYSVRSEGQMLDFMHTDNGLRIHLDKAAKTGEVAEFQIDYAGIPADGLVISKNSHGERTFFGDNWPDRARHWLPCVDHPSDKATLEFKVWSPNHYEVVSNGYLVSQRPLNNNITFTHWKEDVAIPSKLMVIGVADFALGNKTDYKGIPVSSWVFTKDKEKGFQNYKYGTEALQYFSELIGPYSYEKLAHVQSKTRYGGMENAGCIFYHEGTATSDRSQEGLFAHEVAHQWFGNSVTEQNWHHVWLSEGFATYLTHVYKQHFQGQETFIKGLKRDRERIIGYAKQNLSPVIDTTVTDYIRLLNANSYQKAAWFLHMLRMDLGDTLFFEGLREYYGIYKNSTALTEDFLCVMESVSGKELDMFFKQWLWQAGHPVLNFKWKQLSGRLEIFIGQVQSNTNFTFPLEIEIQYENGTTERINTYVAGKQLQLTTEIGSKVKNVVPDPDVKLLFEVMKQN